MATLTREVMAISREIEVIPFRNRLKEYATKIGMSVVNQTKIITAGSELARNMLKYAGGGKIVMEVVMRGKTKGVRVIFKDEGPGIPDVALAMKDGYSTTGSLGLGLPGSRRLVSEFNIESVVGKGTTVTIIKWKDG